MSPLTAGSASPPSNGNCKLHCSLYQCTASSILGQGCCLQQQWLFPLLLSSLLSLKCPCLLPSVPSSNSVCSLSSPTTTCLSSFGSICFIPPSSFIASCLNPSPFLLLTLCMVRSLFPTIQTVHVLLYVLTVKNSILLSRFDATNINIMIFIFIDIYGIDLMNMHNQHYTGEVWECVLLQGMGFVTVDLAASE